MITDNREDYDVNGTKLRKTVKEGNEEQLVQDYVGSIEYRNDVLEAIYHSEGRKVYKDNSTSSEYQYFLKDHLGNNRVVFKDAGNGTAEKVQENHYYPFGMNMGGEWSQTSSTLANNYLFNGYERNTDFGLNVDLAKYRTYDPAIGRWWQVDPRAEVFYGWSTYKFGMNNPLLFNDPNGDCEICLRALRASAAYTAGALNSIASNLVGGAPGTRNDPNDFGDYAGYAAAGQTAGDVISIAVGAAEQALGAAAAVGGVLAAPETGGLSLAASAEGTAVAAHGAVVTNSALNNLLKDSGVVQANDNLNERAGRLNKNDRSGKDFTKSGKDVVKKQNAEKNGGQMKCEGCGNDVVPAERHQRGVSPPGNEAHVDHIKRKREGGRGNPDNGQVLCRNCNLEKH